jgi:hypothetical protein
VGATLEQQDRVIALAVECRIHPLTQVVLTSYRRFASAQQSCKLVFASTKKGIIHMRFITLTALALMVAIGGLVGCNSNETPLSQAPRTLPTPQQPAPPPADNVRRISAAELHDLWQKGDVLVIDTRPESAYKDEHIKGSISMPTGSVLGRIDELPRNKMIVAYCT